MDAQNIAVVHHFLSSLIFTDVVETAVLFFMLRLVFKLRISTSQIIFAGLYASFSTIAYVWFVFPYLLAWSPGVSTFFAELFAFLVEALFYRFVLRISWKTALLASLVCNAFSYFLGPFLRSYGLWIYW
ncbi:MAG TPA: hypothetical protein VMU25_00120 [Candidatus Paceibacterota bacterium]|nr:hypothetical protein [Candidatus Paceibacterota bacterium]